MKHVILFICLALGIGTSAFAQDTKHDRIETKVIGLPETLTFLSVEDGVHIILTEGLLDEIHIEGDARDIKKLRTVSDNGSLHVSYTGNTAPDVKVYVPAHKLKNVNIYGSSVLESASIIKNSKLRILLAGEAKIHVRSTGNVVIEATDDYRFVRGK